MCGIIGYIGYKQTAPILLEGLKRLEYRGYDSAGITLITDEGKIHTLKVAGKVENLVKKAAEALSEEANIVMRTATLGIGHTRWATHGEPNERNAHPHTDCSGKIWIVHNGIIENYQLLKSQLLREGHKFTSETDTEVIAHLIEKFYNTSVNLLQATQHALSLVTGAYAIVAVSSREPDNIVAVKLSSPLRIGIGKDEFFVASDIAAILDHTKDIITLEDREIASINRTGYIIRSLDSNEIQEKPVEHIEWDISQVEKAGFRHFMLKEIYEEQGVVRSALRGRVALDEGNVVLGGLKSFDDQLRHIQKMQIVACGTAAYAGLYAKYLIEKIAGIDVSAEIASEFRYRNGALRSSGFADKEQVALLAISQSGETADTLACVKEAKTKGLLCLGVVNVVGSSIARETHAGVYNHAGPEISVASTKAFISQLVVLNLIAIKLGRQKALSLSDGQSFLKELLELPEKIQSIFKQNDAIRMIAQKYSKAEHFAFLGRKYNFPTALEGALKLKETSYIHAEAYAGGELKHGAIALIDEHFPSVYIIPQDSVYAKNMSNLQEIRSRKGPVIAIATEGDLDIAKHVDDVVYIPQTLEPLYPILATVPLHLFAYHVASLRGCDIDQPRNLAKSVTVE